MMFGNDTSFAPCLIGALVVTLLQIIVAPALAIASAVPDFMAAYAVVCALVRPQPAGVILPFVLGIVYSLVGGMELGAMAFSLVLVTLLVSRLFRTLDNGTLFIPFALLIAGMIAVDCLYGLMLALGGSPVGVGEAFIFRILPCALYDCALCLVLYPLVLRAFAFAGSRSAAKAPLA